MGEIKWSDPTYFTDKHALSMTLRDYFAAKALQGILACNYSVEEEPTTLSYKYADQMLKARETNE